MYEINFFGTYNIFLIDIEVICNVHDQQVSILRRKTGERSHQISETRRLLQSSLTRFIKSKF